MSRKANQCQVVLVNIPLNGNFKSDLQLRYPGNRLANLSAREGMGFIDTLPALEAAMERAHEPLYWPKDGHATGEGYRVIGEVIFRELIQKSLVP
jgi:hypothetical protein